MTVYLGSGTPGIEFDPGILESQCAAFANANGITTQAGWDAAVAGMTAGSALQLAAVKAVFKSIVILPPRP